MTTATAVHVESAIAYAQGCLDGTISVSRLTRRACQRFIDDIAKEQTDWPYRLDYTKAERVCSFAELMPHVKGEWANRAEKIKLEPWQCFILVNVFGWVDKETGLRRFREVYIEVPRKNAKSTLSSIAAHYMLTMDGEEGAGVYSAATTRDQARITFDDGRVMALKSPEYRDRFGVNVGQHAISVLAHNASWKPITRESSANEGLNVHFALLDELHAHKNREVHGVMRQGMGSRRQPILWQITTAGADQSGICYEQRSGIVKILDGVSPDPMLDAIFGVVYTIDPEDEWTDPKAWAKANPNLNVSVYYHDMEAACAKAKLLPGERSEFLTKRLNVWVTGTNPWFDSEAWMRNADNTLTQEIPEEFDGRDVYIGIDFATRRDIAAMVAVFPDETGEYTVFGRYFLPESAVSRSNNASYRGWVMTNWITTTPGDTTDYAFIKRDLLEWDRRFRIQEVAFDPREARQFATEMLNDYGVPMVEIIQTYAAFNEPMKEADSLIVGGKIHHNGDPVLAWAVSNVIARTGPLNGDVMPAKETDDAKIDPAVAMLMALGRAMVRVEAGGWVVV